MFIWVIWSRRVRQPVQEIRGADVLTESETDLCNLICAQYMKKEHKKQKCSKNVWKMSEGVCL